MPRDAIRNNWQRGYRFLDKELQQITKEAELGKRYADKLVQVYRNDGEEVWVLIHVEIQSQQDKNFPKRMFTYNYRIFDRYDRPVVSVAVLADHRPGWKPDSFSWKLWGCQVGIQFPTVKLLDYAKQWSALESSSNPFAICTMAHLKTLETKSDLAARRRWKVNLTRRLYDQGRDKQYVINLFRFIDWVMALPDDLAKGFWEEIQRVEEEKSMPYVTSVEKLGIQKGIQQGIQQGTLQLLQSLLQNKFGEIPPDIDDKLRQSTEKQILKWSENIFTANTLGDIFGH